MQTATFRYADLREMRVALESAGHRQALKVHDLGLDLSDATWLLAMFEVATGSRATAAAGRVARRGSDVYVVFQSHDWNRLVDFASPTESHPPPPIRPKPVRGTVLAVEDERIAREMIASFLEAADLRVHTVVSAEDAIDVLDQLRPDAIVLD